MTNILLCAAAVLVLLAASLTWWWGRNRVTEEQRVEAVRLKKQMEELVASPGWQTVRDIIQRQVEPRKQQVLFNPTSEPYQQEYMKGEVNGMETILRLPATMIETSDAIIRQALEQEGDE